MPYTIQWEAHGVYIQMSGEISAKDVMAVNDAIYQHPNFKTTMCYQLADFLGCTKVHAEPDEVRQIARQDSIMSSQRPGVMVAIVTNSPLLYGYSRMYQICTERSAWETEIFDNVDAAREWIGLKESDTQARPA
jgi:hypothetical protein